MKKNNSQSSENEIVIYNYLNYRKYLKDLFAYKKEKDKLTLRLFARKANLSSHAYLKQIIDGTRTPTNIAISKIARGFDLEEYEAMYLDLLLRFDLAEDTEEKNEIYLKLSKRSKRESSLVQVEKNHYFVFANWYVMAIRELVSGSDFVLDYKRIAKTLVPAIQESQAKEAINILLNTQYIQYNKENVLVPTEPALTTGNDVKSEYIVNYHNNLLKLSALSIQNTKAEFREISSMGFLIDREEFRYIKNRMREFRKEIQLYLKDREESKFPETVAGYEKTLYYINMQLFNASEIIWKEKNTKYDT